MTEKKTTLSESKSLAECGLNLYSLRISRIAFQSIRGNMVRSILTVLIIAVGISALVGILTAIDSIKNSITAEFTRLGANTFSIQSRGMRVQIGNKRYRTKNYAYISYFQAREFRERYTFPASASISVLATQTCNC